ncbi:MAG: hypothetical protein ABWY25_05355, partial [Paenisporosarcina sp.]
MDLFKFKPTSDPTVLEKGERINKTESKMWTERYRDSGEFEITARLSSGLKEFLPEGTLISHTNTYEVMIVENHEIKEDISSDPEIRITGRTMDSWLENRVIGIERARVSTTVSEYTLAAIQTYHQAATLINDHIYTPANANDALSNFVAANTVTGTATVESRQIKPGDLHAQLMELLAVDDLGIRTIRRNSFGVVGSPTISRFEIYKGVDRSAKVIFSWRHGDLESVEYLFSGKKLKNSALVKGRYVWQIVDGTGVKYNRRFMYVDGDDLDGNLSAPPTGTALTTILGKMTTRGKQALKSQTQVTISRTDVSETSKNRYRIDYNLGDIVTLDG